MSEESTIEKAAPKRPRGFTLFVKKLVIGASPFPVEILPGEDRHYVRRKIMDTAKRHGIKVKAPSIRIHSRYQLWVTRIA